MGYSEQLECCACKVGLGKLIPVEYDDYGNFICVECKRIIEDYKGQQLNFQTSAQQQVANIDFTKLSEVRQSAIFTLLAAAVRISKLEIEETEPLIQEALKRVQEI